MEGQTENTSSVTEKGISANKILGYILLSLGVLMILAALYLVWGVLSGKTKAPSVFNIESPSIELPGSQQTLEIPDTLKKAGITLSKPASAQGQKMKLIPDSLYNDSINIGLYYLLMMFLASTGAKIAGIGVNLLKDFKIRVK